MNKKGVLLILILLIGVIAIAELNRQPDESVLEYYYSTSAIIGGFIGAMVTGYLVARGVNRRNGKKKLD